MRDEYRYDIQGLRAFGILLVIAFHIWGNSVSGGVDVFFVVSAYLMTSSLMRSANGTGVNVISFWGRVALRIVPAGATVIFLSLIVGALLMPRSLWQPFSLHALWAALQVENIQLLRDATDYLARGTPAGPFQQFWALSTQMQFYALLPLVVWGCHAFSATVLKQRYNVGLHLLVFALIGTVSFAYAIWALSQYPAPHYFNPLTRAWEFTVGAICAALVLKVKMRPRFAAVASWIGLLMILSCGFVVPPSWPFPGAAALLPVGGAVLVLLSGAGQPSPVGAARLLSLPLLQKAAGISFALYLVHWPTLVFAQELIGTTKLNIVQGSAIILLSLGLAMALRSGVEEPVRKWQPEKVVLTSLPTLGRWFAWATPFGIAVAFTVPAVAFSLAWTGYFSAQADSYIRLLHVSEQASPVTNAAVVIPADFDAQILAVPGYLSDLYDRGCTQSPRSIAVVVCSDGVTSPGAMTMALLGGSHSVMFQPALKTIAERDGFRLISVTKSACPFDGNYIGQDLVGPVAGACAEWAEASIEKIIELKPDVVFTPATRPGAGNVGDVTPDSYWDVWSRFNEAGIAVVAIRDIPRAELFSVPVCLDRNRGDPAKCSLERAAHLTVPSPLVNSAERAPNVTFIDLSDYLCNQRSCPGIIDGTIVYYDNSHLAVPFVQRLTAVLEKNLLTAITKVAPAAFAKLPH